MGGNVSSVVLSLRDYPYDGSLIVHKWIKSSGIAGDHTIIYRRGGQGFDRRMMLLVYDGGKVCTRAPCLDRPTNTIFAVRLTPETLGKLLHSTLRGEHLTVLLLQPTTEVFVGPGIIRAEEATRRIVCRPLKQKAERVMLIHPHKLS